MSDRATEHLVRIDGHRMRLTNLEKVLYPETGTTKGEVIDYYTRVAKVLLPHIAGRPVTRKRWPDGVGAETEPAMSFFAKNLEPGAPGWLKRVGISHSTGSKDYPLVDEAAALVYLAQVASLELHVPQWRFSRDGNRNNPDRLVLDLDPGPGAGLAECAEVARLAREILVDMGLEPVPVTSGSKGVHLYAALSGAQTTDQISTIAKELARAIEADHPDLAVSQMAKAQRDGRVFIDWSQNNGSKTTIAPYSLRGRSHPTVAAPRTWDELADPALDHLTFEQVLRRVESSDDPLAALGFHANARHDAHGPLSAYIAKRTSGKTPEPVPTNALGHSASSHQLPRFVVQEHHASRLHWDLRLERDGVLVSWAVPRGIPHSTSRNSLAVMTEDHPLEYLDFSGTIPRGEYGAGEMTIWDAGRYELEKWRDDEIIFTVEGGSGGPLGRARLALIRTQGEGEKSSWLLHRMKTDAAGAPQHDVAPVAAQTTHSPPPSATTTDLRPMLSTMATPGLAHAAAQRWAKQAWAEIKWDGVRALGIWDGERLRLRARSGNDITAKYPELTGHELGFGPEPAIVDGEIVALDDEGRPSFSRLQARMNLSHPRDVERELPRTPVQYYLFDLLSVGGNDATALPLASRRELLELLTDGTATSITVPPVFDDVDAALSAAREFALEGVVVKNPSAPYQHGVRSEDWLKVKLTRTQEVVVGGIRPGKAHAIGSLLVGIPDGDELQYAGRVGSGFSDATLRLLESRLNPLRTEVNPFQGVPKWDAADAHWVSPEVVAEVEFAEFTPGGILRHARWRGFRADKAPAEVRRED
ncbi:ATP-dependent DNA ligase [Microbacterium sp. NPDC076911]|uniref:ATP-dependent DNA ligase n=1 Tax=Microbacterium sp. NPDC076911 TaxID=3154958 RepID=UPI00341661BD